MNNIENRPEIAKRIIRTRRAKKITQKELAQAASLPLNTIKRIEAGTYIPPYSIISKIAPLLSVSPLDIMDTDPKHYGQTTGFSEYVDRDYEKIKKLIPSGYEIIEGGIGLGTANDLEIVYSKNDEIISTSYSKLGLIDEVNKIKAELDAKYQEELTNRMRLLFEDICTPSPDAIKKTDK